MSTALAALPIVAILGLMLGLGWSAASAGLAGLALALLLAFTALASWGEGTVLELLAGVGAEGGFIALTILWILWPALALHEHQQASGAIATLRAALARLSPDPRLQALLVGWFLALFFEGAAGFGTPVALAAPLLVSLGLPPLQAVVLALLGHALGVSFGALGTPVAAQVALTGLDAAGLAWRTALLNAAMAAVMVGFFAMALKASGPVASPDRSPRAPASARPGPLWPWLLLAMAGFVLPSLALALLLGPELPTLGGALLGGLLFAAVLHWRNRERVSTRPGGAQAAAAPGPALTLVRALAPYGVLVALVLFTRALPPVAESLGAVALRWQLWDRFGAGLQPLLHPGTLLLVALLAGAWLQGRPLRTLGPALATSARRLLPVSVALLAMLCLSRLMLHAGMIDTLQQAAVAGLGQAWPLVAPAVGALGSFVTGSATASNVLFTTLQVQTAQALALSPLWMAAAQGLGAGLGNIVCPHNIVAGAATVGLAGREAEVLRRTVLPCAVVLVLGGLLVRALV